MESGDSISLVCENSISYVTSSAHEQEEKEVIRNCYFYNMYMYNYTCTVHVNVCVCVCVCGYKRLLHL